MTVGLLKKLRLQRLLMHCSLFSHYRYTLLDVCWKKSWYPRRIPYQGHSVSFGKIQYRGDTAIPLISNPEYKCRESGLSCESKQLNTRVKLINAMKLESDIGQ